MVLRSCSKRAIRSLCAAAVAMASVTWACSSAQRPVPKETWHQRRCGAIRGALSPPCHSSTHPVPCLRDHQTSQRGQG